MRGMSLDGFESYPFTHDGIEHEVFRRGEGPGIVIMPEMPGITPVGAALARRIADDGFTVHFASLFGEPGKSLTLGYALAGLTRACVSHELSVFARNESSPIVNWLRALCRQVHAERGGPGVGALGMCFTGNFALALMVDPTVVAPVLSQPSLPGALTRSQKRALHLNPGDLSIVKARATAGCPVLGMRFTADVLCPTARFDRLRNELGDAFESIEIDSRPGNPHGISRFAHSVLTYDLVDEAGHPTRAARDRLLSFFHERLDGVRS